MYHSAKWELAQETWSATVEIVVRSFVGYNPLLRFLYLGRPPNISPHRIVSIKDLTLLPARIVFPTAIADSAQPALLPLSPN